MPTTRPGDLERRTHAVVLRSRLAVGAGAAAAAALVLTVALGLAALVCRSLVGVDPWSSAPLAVPVAVVPTLLGLSVAWGALRSRRLALSERDAALWLDVRAGATGEVVTQRELQGRAERWRPAAEARLERPIELPSVPWRRAAMRAGVGLVFLALTFLAPVRRTAASTRFEALFDERLDEVRDQLEALSEEVALEEEDRVELEEALERLEADASSDPDLEATYEAIDRLEERLAERAEEAAEAAERAARAMQRAGEAYASAAGTSESDAGELDPSTTESAPELSESELAEALADAFAAASELSLESLDLAASSDALADALELADAAGLDLEALAELAREGGLGALDAEALAELSEALVDAMGDSLAELADAGLLDPSKPARLSELPTLSSEQLARLAELAQDAEPCPDCGRTDPGEPGEP